MMRLLSYNGSKAPELSKPDGSQLFADRQHVFHPLIVKAARMPDCKVWPELSLILRLSRMSILVISTF
jgi:hypothetical protein